ALAGTKPHPESEADQLEQPEVEHPETEPAASEPEAAEPEAAEPEAAEPAGEEERPEKPVEVTWARVAQPDTPSDETETSDQGETPVEPAQPIVVTSTRRRRAARPAGPPTATSGDDPAESASPADSEGPPAPEDQSEAGAEHEHLLHVPIKKKGSRKR
ncbi:MAG TPA: hypothetical protein VF416_11880, partial [Marmoricola sp.]